MEQLEYIFGHLLREVKRSHFVDIGCRFGPVLFAACLFGDFSSIIGVDLNQSLVEVGRNVAFDVGVADRIEVFCLLFSRYFELNHFSFIYFLRFFSFVLVFL